MNKMPIEIGPEGAAFNLSIPSLEENADIQEAFRIYHYGQNNLGVGELNPNSVAGYLDELEKDKIDKDPTIIPFNANLNDYTDSGFYSQDTNAKAQSGSNYPEINGFRYAGLLRVINDGGNIFQEYQVGGLSTSPVFWRRRFGNDINFSPWQTYSRDGHVHDTIYYRKTEVDSFIAATRTRSIRQIGSSTSGLPSDFYILQRNDANSFLFVNNLSRPNNLIIPRHIPNSENNIPVGSIIRVVQANTGQTTIIGETGDVIVRTSSGNRLRSIWSVANMIKAGENLWVISGDLDPGKTKSQLRNEIGIYVQQNEPTGNIQNGDLWFW
jgi:hypothetical protein